ncbi:5'-nucleotidase C-terminal domain-containing protein [Ilyobacter polytropus]|uniref:5'-Nucleotidase domain protein n=1 Tax=Ilyobacter polytropus (strain ATCC 51220 / DSM 2926 / LMG 16218 / CuHBu1) TaxID=572544 RepID=E3H666_ILYPC|nr:5'-nucleotidase C-terminal domain-containing protein [Ilyobacter polytropus]ADO81825.1 5'-Nucleotidase domain protein [Ilyobacter polytropus DSM 2926]
MKRKFYMLSGTALLLALTACSNGDIKEDTELSIKKPKDFKLVVAHINDTHGRVEEGKYDGMGFPRISTVLKDLRKENDNVLFLDAGDTIHGTTFATLSEGESVVEILNYMKLDASTPGNHDFNYGKDRLKEIEKLADYEILGANVVTENGGKFIEPYIIKDMNGVSIGVFGIATPETAYKTNPKNVDGIKFGDPVEYSKKSVQELKSKGADFIIALTHLGMDESTKDGLKSTDIAKSVEGIDLIIDGHSHTTLEDGMVVNKTTIVQTGEYDKNMGIVHIKVENGVTTINPRLISKEEALGKTIEREIAMEITEKLKVNEDYLIKDGDTLSEISYSTKVPVADLASINEISNVDLIYKGNTIMVPVEKNVTKTVTQVEKVKVGGIEKDPQLVKLIDSIKGEQKKITQVKIGETPVSLNGERKFVRTGETNLANMITEAMLWKTGADIALTNGGGIRASIPAGEITVGDIISVLPFGNYVVTKEMTGSEVIEALEHGISDYPATKGAFPQIAGMKVQFDPSKAPGERLVSVTMNNGEELLPDSVYLVATNDFIAAGGDDYKMFKGKAEAGNFEGLDEILMDYIKAKGITERGKDNRISVNK